MAELFTKITAESAGSSPYEFNSVSIGSGNSFEPTTTQAQAGSYSYKATMGGTAVASYGIKNFSATSPSAYIKAYIYVSSDWNYSTSGRYTSLITLRTTSGLAVTFAILRPAGQASPIRWQVYDRVNTTTTTINFSLGAWHKVEIYWQRGAGDGIARVWVDDDLIHEYTNLTTLTQDAASVRVGATDDYNPTVSGCYICIDEIEGFDEIPTSGGGSLPAIINNYRQQGVM